MTRCPRCGSTHIHHNGLTADGGIRLACADCHRSFQTAYHYRPLLTARELELLTAVAQGQTSKHIGQRHGLTEQTVKNYLATIQQKLGTENRAHSVYRAFVELGLAQPKEEKHD